MRLQANEFTATTRPDADGTGTFVLTGHQVVFMYPTDHPAGPSTTLSAGRRHTGRWAELAILGYGLTTTFPCRTGVMESSYACSKLSQAASASALKSMNVTT